MAKQLFRSVLFVAMAVLAACTVQNSELPGLSGPSEGTGPLTVPVQTPTARFSFAPAAPVANSPVQFDGTLSCTGPADPNGIAPCSTAIGTITSYSWNFGDGTSALGPVASHQFDTPQSYAVTLTVTNSSGRSHTTSHPVNVGAGLLPTALFTFSPTSPLLGQTVVFNASTSTAGVGHSIAGFTWEFGDNTPLAGGQVTTHAFLAAGTFVVTLTVVDDDGQAASVTRTLAVGTGNPTAVLSLSKAGGMNIQADASASSATGGATIVNYTFSWGDASPNDSGPASVANHTYPPLVPPATSSTFTVRLTVTDSLGRTATTSQNVTVP